VCSWHGVGVWYGSGRWRKWYESVRGGVGMREEAGAVERVWCGQRGGTAAMEVRLR
jgi:hypothetical protein